MKVWKNVRGFTLVETVVSMAILSIIVLMFFSNFVYDLNLFRKGSDTVDEQSNLRLISFKLTEEFRNVAYIDLLESAPDAGTVASTTDKFIYLDDDKLISKVDSASDVGLSNSPLQSITFSLRHSEGKYYLGITLLGANDTFSTEVLLNNIVSDDSSQMDSGDLSSAADFTAARYNFNYS